MNEREANEVHEGGVLAAVFFSLLATVGYFMTTGRTTVSFDWLWIGVFAISLLTLSMAIVNFDVRKLVK